MQCCNFVETEQLSFKGAVRDLIKWSGDGKWKVFASTNWLHSRGWIPSQLSKGHVKRSVLPVVNINLGRVRAAQIPGCRLLLSNGRGRIVGSLRVGAWDADKDTQQQQQQQQKDITHTHMHSKRSAHSTVGVMTELLHSPVKLCRLQH